MNDADWGSRLSKIEPWIKTYAPELKKNELHADALDSIRRQIKRGNSHPGLRVKFYKVMLEEGRDLPHWPVKKGKESNLPTLVITSKTTMAEAMTVYADIWDNNPIVQEIERVSDRNKEHGAQPYENGADYASAKISAAQQRFVNLFKAGRWNGVFEVGNTTVTLPPAEEAVETSESEESDTDESSN